MSLIRRTTTTLGLLGALLLHPSIGAAYTVENPTEFDIEAIYRHLAADPPDFDTAARQTDAYLRANEFERADALAREKDRLKQQYDALAEADLINIRLNARLSEYDSEKGVYYIDSFDDGSYIPFGDYGLSFDNAATFREWSLPVDRAQEVRELSPDGRISAVIQARPFGLSPKGGRMLRGQIVSLKLYVEDRLLHEVEIPESEYRAIERPGSEAAKGSEIAAEKHNVLGIPIGLDLDETLAQLQDAGFSNHVTMTARDEFTPTAFATSPDSLTRIDPAPEQAQTVTEDGEPDIAAILANQEARRNEIYDSIMEGRSGRSFLLDGLGEKLDCNGTADILPSCGYVLSDAEGKTRSIILLQQAAGASKSAVTQSLIDKYGSPTDRFPATLLRAARGEQLVWGLASNELADKVGDITDISGHRHWQIEAVISEPEPGRTAVLVQINDVPFGALGDGTGTKAGQIKF